jgi:transcriptional regulator with XRE-family HTH domain
MLVKNSRGRNRTASHIQIVPNTKDASGDTFDLLGAELGNDATPLADSGRADANRSRDVRGLLKVVQNGFLEHKSSLTLVQSNLQPRCKNRVLTLVEMDHLSTAAERLKAAMKDAGVSQSDLARACRVSPTAVGKWLHDSEMKADNLACVSRCLGIREDWLRTGRLPKEREKAEEERDLDQVIVAMSQIVDLLAPLVAALDQFIKSHSATTKTRKGKKG